MIVDDLKIKINQAMKAGDRLKVDTLKMLSAALTNAEISKNRQKLTEEEEIKIVQSEIKKRLDAIELYQRAGEQERVEKEKKEIKILKEYLPEQISDEDLEREVDAAIKEIGAGSAADIGRVMGLVMKKVGTSAGGNRVSSIVKEKLS